MHRGVGVVEGRHAGRVAIVTGASRGIGREVAIRLAAEGASVVVAAKSESGSDRLPGSIHETVAAIEQAGGQGLAIKVDVRDDDQVKGMVDAAVDRFGKLDILFNNAGAIHLADVADTPAKRFDLVVGVNVRAAFLASHHALPHMVANGWGHILMFSPELHVEPSPHMAAYMISKLGMTRTALAIAEEHRDNNVAANSIWPVTMIESYATINHGMGDETQWRTPEIICDAVSDLFAREPRSCTGRQLTDEQILREAGITDFDQYWKLGAPPEQPVLLVGPDAPLR